MKSLIAALILLVLPAVSWAASAAEAIVRLEGNGCQCSGVCVTPDGGIMTARHCNFGDSVTVFWRDGRTVSAQRIWAGSAGPDDVTVYTIGHGQWPHLKIAPQPPHVGEQVWMAGYPAGEWKSYKVTVVNEFNSFGQRYAEVDLVAKGGWSGGPLVNEKGEVCGILSTTDAGILRRREAFTTDGRSQLLHHSVVARAFAQSCPNGLCPLVPYSRPRPGTPDQPPAPRLGEQAPPPNHLEEQPGDPEDFDWSHARIVALIPEKVTGLAGAGAALIETHATGPLRRAVANATGGKARLDIVFQRLEPTRFGAVLEAGGLAPSIQVLVLVKEHNQPGIVRDMIIAKVAKAVDERLANAPIEVIFERISGEDFAAISGALAVQEPTEPPVYEREGGGEVDPSALDNLKQIPVIGKKVADLQEALEDKAAGVVTPVVEKAEGLIPESLRDGLLGFISVLAAGGVGQSFFASRKMKLALRVFEKAHQKANDKQEAA